MHVEKRTITVTTNGSGAGTAYSSPFTGRVLEVRYVKAGSGNYSDGVDFDVTLESSGAVIWSQDDVNASVTKFPRVTVHDAAGDEISYDGTNPVAEPIAACNDRVLFTVAQGGASKSGSFVLTIDGTFLSD